jgi:hypothetical protein
LWSITLFLSSLFLSLSVLFFWIILLKNFILVTWILCTSCL